MSRYVTDEQKAKHREGQRRYRDAHPESVKAAIRRYKSTERGRLAKAAWESRHREKHLAQRSAENAVRDGRLVRPETCGRCGARGRIEAHHEDYSRRLDVLWLCKECHRVADGARRERQQ